MGHTQYHFTADHNLTVTKMRVHEDATANYLCSVFV